MTYGIILGVGIVGSTIFQYIQYQTKKSELKKELYQRHAKMETYK